MTLDPSKCTLFGGENILITLDDTTSVSTDAEYYLIFEGQQERHVTKANRVNTKVIKAIIPEHHTAEPTQLTVLCQKSTKERFDLLTTTFEYVDCMAHKVARNLVASVDNPMALEPQGPLKWNGFDLSGEDLGKLDAQLLKVFLEMKLPRDWNLLGEDYNLPEIPPRESLLHLAARLGLQQLTEFLMYQPGSLDAVCLENQVGEVPLDIAQSRNDTQLVNTLLGKNYYGTGGPPWLEKWKKPRQSTMVQRHENGMATITNDVTKSKRTIDDDIQLLHNMSKVVYDDSSVLQTHQQQQQDSTIRQRHSMAEDYHRQKLYYSDASQRQQRHSMAEQRQGNRLFNIDIQSNSQGNQPTIVSPSPRQGRSGVNKPRLPSPERKSDHESRAQQHQQQQQQKQQQPTYPRSDRNSSHNVHNQNTQYSSHNAHPRLPMERSRERRPISTTDTYNLEKQLIDESYQRPSEDHQQVLPPRRSGYLPSSTSLNEGISPARRRPAPDPPKPPPTQQFYDVKQGYTFSGGENQQQQQGLNQAHNMQDPSYYDNRSRTGSFTADTKTNNSEVLSYHGDYSQNPDNSGNSDPNSGIKLRTRHYSGHELGRVNLFLEEQDSVQRQSSWETPRSDGYSTPSVEQQQSPNDRKPDSKTGYDWPNQDRKQGSTAGYDWSNQERKQDSKAGYDWPNQDRKQDSKAGYDWSMQNRGQERSSHDQSKSGSVWAEPYHPRSSSMEGVGGTLSFVDINQDEEKPQTNSLGRNGKYTSRGYSLPPTDVATYTSETVLHFNADKPKRPSSAGHASRRTDPQLLQSTGKPPVVPRQPTRPAVSHGRSSSMEGTMMGKPLKSTEESPKYGDTPWNSQAGVPSWKHGDSHGGFQKYENLRIDERDTYSPRGDTSKSEYSENSEDESFMSHDSQGRRYKRRTVSQVHGEHHRRIYQKHSDKMPRKAASDPVTSPPVISDQDAGDYVQVFQSPDGTQVNPFSYQSPGGQGVVLEDNLRRLQEIQDNIHKLREYNVNQNNEISRRDSLQRFSTSCPSLADKLLQSAKVVTIDNSEHHKSMQDLNREAPMSPPVDAIQRPLEARPDIQIYVNDVTVGTSSDFNLGQEPGDDPEMLLIEEMKKNQRRSSWCPEEERKKEEKTEKQRLLLGVCGRSQSLSSLEGEEEDDSDDSDSDSHTQQQHSIHQVDLHDIQYMDVDAEDEDEYDEEDEQDREESQSPPVQNPEILISSPDGAVTATPPGESTRNRSQLTHRSSDGSIVSPCSSIPSPHRQSLDDVDGLSMPGSLPKAASTPSINSNQDTSVDDKKRSGSIGTANGTPPNISKRSRLSSEDMGHEGPLVEGTANDHVDKTAPTLSMLEFLNDPTNYTETDQSRREENKDDKKRKSSVFAKFPSYRGKKVVKDNKALPSTHQFVSVSFSNSTACDVCGKSMANKSALQCENCMVNVHESSCKDQISQCARSTRRGSTKVGRFQSTSLPGHARPLAGSVKLSQSFKEPSRVNGNGVNLKSLQTSQSVTVLQNRGITANSMSQGTGPHGTGYFQWRRVATKLGIDKPEDELSGSQLVPESTNLADVLSVSMESIEEEQSHDFEVDNNLIISANEPEAWSVTVDKKTLKKMSAKDIKRQDHIWEFIQTEKSHCRTLRIMHKIFYTGLVKECELGKEMVDRIFPQLFDLLDIHKTFLDKLVKLQQANSDRSIDSIGNLLYEQFGGLLGDQMKQAYGEFCSRHHESVQLYKDILKDNKKVQAFAKKCSHNINCKRLDIPACILLVTQRTSKYPLLIESILKATKEFKEEKENLILALSEARNILEFVDRRIDEHEKYQKLIEIYNRVDARSYAMFKGTKFKKSGLLSNGRKLLHEGYIKWMNARGKSFEVLAVILSDVMFFLTENNGKLSFFSQDNKSSVISLSKLLVREKGDTKDSKGIYLICQSKTEPEMYELVCKSAHERKYWIQVIKDATAHCVEEEVGAARNEEDRKLLEARSAKLRQLVDQLRQRDEQIRAQCDEKMKVFSDMVELFGKDEQNEQIRMPLKDEEGQDLQDADTLLQAAIQQGEKLITLLQSSAHSLGGSSSGTNLSRSVSSVGEHSTGNTTPPLPKRAETFSGFENKDNGRIKKRFPSTKIDGSNSSSQTLDTADNAVSLETKCSPQRRISVAVPYAIQENSKPKEKIHRRSSTSFLQNLLTKQHVAEKGGGSGAGDDSDNTSNKSSDKSDKSSDRGSALDLSGLSPAVSISNLALSKEQCTCVAQLMQYVHGLACLATHKGTEAESFRAQLSEANAKISRLYTESDRVPGFPEKKTYDHDKQLEELRNLQEQLNQERSQFEKERTKQNLEIHHERQDIKKEWGDMDKQRGDIKKERDELQRQKEALQKQMDLFEEQRSQFVKLQKAQHAEIASPGGQRERSESPASSGGGSLERTHKRTGSNDFYHHHHHHGYGSREGSPFENVVAASQVGQGNITKDHKVINKSRSNSSSSGSNATGKSILPLHLASTSNEIKGGHVQQKLPLKLASNKPGAPATSAKPQVGSTGIKQVLPFKLSSISTSQSTGGSSHGNSPKQQLMHTKSQPSLTGVKKTSQLNTHNSSSNFFPMKLAEKSQQKPKSSLSSAFSAKSSPMSPPPSDGNVQQHSGKVKKEKEIFLI